jgi:hypothetical protein
MMVLALLSWWYTAGWARLANRAGERISSMLETFSVSLLLRTLFNPFRQIDAGGVRGPLDVQMRAWFDRSFSRLFGAAVRSFFILMGLGAAFFIGILGLVELVLWPFVPLLPLIGAAAAATGWTP